MNKASAWGVHIFTSLGILACFMALRATVGHEWPTAMTWLLVALMIDGVDGTIARRVNVKEVLPGMNGMYIDYVIDFTSYAVVPAFMFYESALVPQSWNLLLTCLILMVSALYYGRVKMVTDDQYFIGFPVLWNMVVFYYIFIANFSGITYALITIFICILHFVPIKMAYPSRNHRLFIPTLLVFIFFVAVMILAIISYPVVDLWIQVAAYLVLAYFILLTIYDTWIRA